MVLGLFKPWVVLWWQPIQTRRKLIKLYGAICLFSVVLYVIASLIN